MSHLSFNLSTNFILQMLILLLLFFCSTKFKRYKVHLGDIHYLYQVKELNVVKQNIRCQETTLVEI